MPFDGEHAARQVDPLEFQDDTFRRYINNLPSGVSFVMGKPKGKDQLQVQSVRFNAADWSVAESKKWLKENDYLISNFEEALTKSWTVHVPISKVSQDERLAFGWASVIADAQGDQVIDHQDDRISASQLERAAYEYVEHSRQSTEMHVKKGIAELVESCVITPEKREAMGMPEGLTGWWIGFRVNDPDVWGKVKDGTYSEFSIGGSAKRVAA